MKLTTELLEKQIMKEIIQAKIAVCFVDVLNSSGCQYLESNNERIFSLTEQFKKDPKHSIALELGLKAIFNIASGKEKEGDRLLCSASPGLKSLLELVDHPYPEESPYGEGFGQGKIGILGLKRFGLPVSKALVSKCIAESAKSSIEMLYSLVKGEGSCAFKANSGIGYVNLLTKNSNLTDVMKNIGIKDIRNIHYYVTEEERTKQYSSFFNHPFMYALLLTGRMTPKQVHSICDDKGRLRGVGECLENKNIFKLLFTDKLAVKDLVTYYNESPANLKNLNIFMTDIEDKKMLDITLNNDLNLREFYKQKICTYKPGETKSEVTNKPSSNDQKFTGKVEPERRKKKVLRKIPRKEIPKKEAYSGNWEENLKKERKDKDKDKDNSNQK